MEMAKKERLPDSDGKVRPFQCKECGKRFTARGSLRSHRSVHTGEKPYKCDECGLQFTQVGQLLLHIRLHTGEKPHQCADCGKKFTQKSTLMQHSRTHRAADIPCGICGKKFRQKTAMQNHELSHTSEKTFACDECPKRFKLRCNLSSHKKRGHVIELAGKYECDVCKARFYLPRERKKHIYVHTGGRPRKYKCDQCDASFAAHQPLRYHKIKVHLKIYPFKCEKCGKHFLDNFAKKIHMRLHTGERPYKCSMCGDAFHSHLKLYKHKRKYDDSILECDLPNCTFKCHKEDQFEFHMFEHKVKWPIPCEKCEKKFPSNDALKCHLLEHDDPPAAIAFNIAPVAIARAAHDATMDTLTS